MMNPTKPQNPLILSHSSILLPASTQNPMALFLNSRLCRCYILRPFTPTQFPVRQIELLPGMPSLCQNSPKSYTNTCDPSVSDAVCLVSNRESGCSDRRITAFPHFQNSFYLIVQSNKLTWYMYPIFYPTQVNAIKHL